MKYYKVINCYNYFVNVYTQCVYHVEIFYVKYQDQIFRLIRRSHAFLHSGLEMRDEWTSCSKCF